MNEEPLADGLKVKKLEAAGAADGCAESDLQKLIS